MGKKINKEDVKKTQKALIIWTSVIVVLVLAVAIGVAMKMQPLDTQNTANNAAVQQNQSQTVGKANASTNVQNQNGQQAQAQPNNNNVKQPVQANNTQAQNILNNIANSAQNDISLAEIQTTKGAIQVVLQNKRMPITVNNFTKLVNKGFYNGLTFHRVEDWVIQGGDPKGNGMGGSDETIQLETSPELKNVRGALAMARSNDPNSASSQFYILKKDASWLDGQYAVFGSVMSGMDVVDKMEIGDKILSIKLSK